MSIEIAESYENNEEFDRAYIEFKKILERKPKNVDILQRTAHLAMMLDKKDEAKELYIRLLELDSTNILAYEQLTDICINTDKYMYYVYRGNLNICQGKIEYAINDFKKALEKASEDAQRLSMHFMLGSLYEKANKHHKAIDEYLRIIDVDEMNKAVYFKLADLYENLETSESSIDILERAKEKGLEDDELNEKLAKLYLKNNAPTKAQALTKDVLTRARSLMDDNKEDEALELLESVRSEYKKNPEYHALIAQYYFQKERYEEALNAVEEHDKFKKNSPLTYQMRALIYGGMQDEYLEHINWAKYNILRENKDVALNEYLYAHQLKEDDVELVASIANLMESLNDRNGAMEFYEKLINLEPNNKKALEKLAEFRMNFGDYSLAIEYSLKLYATDKRNLNLVKRLAIAYEKTKQKSKALEFYEKFISLNPDKDENERIKKKIQKLETKKYTENEATDGGLIDWIMKFFK